MTNQLGTSLTADEYSFNIPSSDVNGPLNLKETILSAQTSEPEWLKDEVSFTDIEEFGGVPVKYTLSQVGNTDDFVVRVRALSSAPRERLIEELRSHLNSVLGLKDDLPRFYQSFANNEDPLAVTFSRLRGLRLMRGTDLYESLISSILSQNNSAILWNRTVRLLMKHYGKRVNFPDGSFSYLFPSPEALSKVRAQELRKRTSMGYRAKSVAQVSRLVAKRSLSLEDLNKCSYEEAMEILLALPGVGPKVADCFLLYGLGKLEAAPVDVWIHRIVTRLYYGGRKVSRLKTASFLRERYREWAGYAQLYLFDFARRTAPLGGTSEVDT